MKMAFSKWYGLARPADPLAGNSFQGKVIQVTHESLPFPRLRGKDL
jgi:hypothetical protein